jgi:hypothetical protein
MKTFTFAMAAAVFSANAFACPVADKLAERYGISFSGFDTPIPSARAPAGANGGGFVRMPIRESMLVSDGFRHTAVLHPATKQAWILRTGGFAGVYEWYGPVDVGDMPLDGCQPVSPPGGASGARREVPGAPA